MAKTAIVSGARTASAFALTWQANGMAAPAPVTLVTGEEEFLVDRTVRELATQARQALGEAGDDGGDLHDIEASALGPGELTTLTSPSLFGGGSVVIVRAAQNAAKEVAADLVGYAARPSPDAVVILAHAGGAKGKALVADLAVEGRLGDALEQLRWALATGTAPVLITSALANGVRLLGRVGAAGGKNPAALAGEVGAPPWKIDQVRRQLRGWHPDGVAAALQAVAEADAQVKGDSVSAGYALERAVRRIVQARSAAR